MKRNRPALRRADAPPGRAARSRARGEPAAAEPAVPGPARPEIRAEGIHKAFGEQVVLRDVNLEVHRGEIVAIVGASGGGKTVLLHILLGLVKPDRGRVLVAHHGREGSPLVDLGPLAEDELDEVRLTWAVVFQKNALLSASVSDNCALWLREHTDMPEDEVSERVTHALEAVGLDPDDVLDKERDELSGGMAKRVAVARAIAVDPLVLFYDEPTTGLDPMHANRLQELIWKTHHEPREDGRRRTTVIVTHDRDLLRRLAPRVAMLHEAGVCFDGPYEEFTASKEGPAQEYLQRMPGLHSRPIRS